MYEGGLSPIPYLAAPVAADDVVSAAKVGRRRSQLTVIIRDAYVSDEPKAITHSKGPITMPLKTTPDLSIVGAI